MHQPALRGLGHPVGKRQPARAHVTVEVDEEYRALRSRLSEDQVRPRHVGDRAEFGKDRRDLVARA